jgi:hypothetical protein
MALRSLGFAVLTLVVFQGQPRRQSEDVLDDVAHAAAAVPSLLSALKEHVRTLAPESAQSDAGADLVAAVRQLDDAAALLAAIDLGLLLQRRAVCDADREMIRAKVQENFGRLVGAFSRATSRFGEAVSHLDLKSPSGELAGKAKVQLECATLVLRRSPLYRAALVDHARETK